MDQKHQATVTLYSAQDQPVVDAIEAHGVCYSNRAYVASKYQESAASFLLAYTWFAEQAEQIVPRPAQAELPYWAFTDQNYASCADYVLTLQVPAANIIYFDMFDWTKILQMKFLGSEAEEKAFAEELSLYGLTEYKVMQSAFYPEFKARILASWARLFRFHATLAAGSVPDGIGAVQTALWQIENTWITDRRAC